jgi:hypothetical protein
MGTFMISRTTRLLILFVATLFMVSNASACPGSATCPVDGQRAVPTGATKYMNGHQWGEFVHSTGTDDHKFWVQCD